jgi:hypothetical protein
MWSQGTLAREIPGHTCALGSLQTVPQQDDRGATEVPLQGAQNPDERPIGIRPGPSLKIQATPPPIPPKGQRGRNGQALPIGTGVPQDRRVPPRGPRAPDYGLVGEAALVFEDEHHARRPARAFFYASPARALPCGHGGLVAFPGLSSRALDRQFRARNKYLTWPG